jgi:hypothetical protein
MGCRSDYLAVTAKEAESRFIAQQILRVSRNVSRVDLWIKMAASEAYGNPRAIDKLTRTLCKLISKFTPEEEDRFLWNGRDPESRRLATWWQAHLEVDDKALIAKTEKKQKEQDVKNLKLILDRLTPELTATLVRLLEDT